jgi:hypothetical protein
MLIDTVIIRLTKSGVGTDPDYSLSIYGNGKVLYEGAERVKVKGVVESRIDSDKVLSLLSEFKEKGFFSLNDSYGEEDTNIRPHTKISISFQKKDGETIAKRVIYYKGDINAPKELIELGDKIEEIVGTDRWVVIPPDYKEQEEKKEKEKIAKSINYLEKERARKKKSKRVVTVTAVLAVVAIVVIAVYFGIFSQTSQEKIDYKTLEITVLEPASNVRGIRDYDKSTIFNHGDTIWIYEEYTNVSTIDSQNCNITIEILVKDQNNNILHFDKTNKTVVGNYGQAWWFVTDDKWDIGVYYATSILTDNITLKNATKTTVFVLM